MSKWHYKKLNVNENKMPCLKLNVNKNKIWCPLQWSSLSTQSHVSFQACWITILHPDLSVSVFHSFLFNRHWSLYSTNQKHSSEYMASRMAAHQLWQQDINMPRNPSYSHKYVCFQCDIDYGNPSDSWDKLVLVSPKNN